MTEGAFLAARLRAEGSIPAAEAAGVDLDEIASSVGRRVVRTDDRLRWGWDDGHEPAPEGPDGMRVSGFATMLLSALLGLCWRDPADDPYPGESLDADAIDILAAILDRDRKIIQKFLSELRAVGLVETDDNGMVRLGPKLSTLPPRTVTSLRRSHHVFAAAVRPKAMA